MKKKTESCIPLVLEHTFEEQVEFFQKIPSIPEFRDAMREHMLLMKEKDFDSTFILMFLLCRWKESKQIYRLTDEIYQDISEMDDVSFPVASLHLPYPCVYIDLRGQMPPMSGAFVFLGDVLRNGQEHYFCVSFISDGDTDKRTFYTLSFYIKDLDDDACLAEAIRSYSNEVIGEKPIRVVFNILAYLSSAKPDILENPAQKMIYKDSKREHMQYKEIRKWDVGVRYTQEVRKTRAGCLAESHSPSNKGRQRPRPHMRKAHWQRFWVGPGRTVCRPLWIAPTVVNAGGEQPAVVHIKKDWQ